MNRNCAKLWDEKKCSLVPTLYYFWRVTFLTASKFKSQPLKALHKKFQMHAWWTSNFVSCHFSNCPFPTVAIAAPLYSFMLFPSLLPIHSIHSPHLRDETSPKDSGSSRFPGVWILTILRIGPTRYNIYLQSWSNRTWGSQTLGDDLLYVPRCRYNKAEAQGCQTKLTS